MAQIELNAFADYALSTFDYSADFEEDAFAVTWDGARIYVERKRNHFAIHIGSKVHKLPRC